MFTLRMWLLFAAVGLLEAQSGFTISGTAVEHATGQPLRNVVVSVLPAEPSGTGKSYLTQSDGRFTFPNLTPGKYNLTMFRRGFLPQTFQEHDGFSTAIAVGPGLDSEHIIFPSISPASISGTVMDEQGDPVHQAQVWLFRKGVFSGRTQVTSAGTQNTDSSGEFTFAHLESGTYFVAVQAHPWYAQNMARQREATEGDSSTPASSNLDVAYPVTYYADTADVSAASPITLAEGSSVRIQVTLRPLPALRVELPSSSQPGKGVSAWANAIGPGGYVIAAGAVTSSLNNHQLITGLAPGHYLITLQEFGERGPEISKTIAIDLNANQILDADSGSKTTLSGRIAMSEGELPQGLTLFFAQSTGGGRGAQASVARDGNFNIFNTNDPTLVPGPYEIQLRGAPGIYLKSIEAKGAKVSGNEIEIADGASVQLSLIAAKGTSRIEGIVMKDDKPFAGALVLLVPKAANRSDFIRRDQSDSDGTFTLNDVPPGIYTLLAIDNGHDLAYREPSVIAPYLPRGLELTVPIEKASVKVNVIERQ